MSNINLILALKFTEKLGEKTLVSLLKSFPNISENDLRNNEEIHKILRYKSVVEKISDENYIHKKLLEAETFIDLHRKKGIEIISLNSIDYPELLKQIDDPPPIIYCKGNINLLKENRNIAIIGTREPTKYGEVATKKIARHFASENYTIVSGLAKGIDTFGHIGALEAQNGKTIAVMGGSLDKIYPSENKILAEEILLKDGLLISEIGIGEKTYKGSFVRRDRIQSGLSLGVCPVQAPLKSGTHHTINFAKLQKRLVFCPLPMEKIEVEATQGIYKLIDEGVPIIRDSEDYNKVYKLLEEVEINLLGNNNLNEENRIVIYQYSKELEKILKQGIKIVDEKDKLEELVLDTLNKVIKETDKSNKGYTLFDM